MATAQSREPMSTPWQAERKKGLACVLCRQRKVKCDRESPCGYCVRSNVVCVPRANTDLRQRRRRFPERELLDRLRQYEEILRREKIPFESLHRSLVLGRDGGKLAPSGVKDEEVEGNTPSPSTAGSAPAAGGSPSVKDEPVFKGRDLLEAIRGSAGADSTFPEDDDDEHSDASESVWHGPAMDKGWNALFPQTDHLLFQTRDPTVDLTALHPPQAQVFKFWQLYLDNVNPLLKVTHIPTLQPRIIDAAGNINEASPELVALLFAIYSISLISLSDEECEAAFQGSKSYLLSKYQYGCRQALLECKFLRSADLDCITAMFLHLISSMFNTGPRALSSTMGAVIRVAQRMGMDSEAENAKCNAVDGQIRRRLWWAMVLFDFRIGELASQKVTALTPTWDCKPPQNFHDFDLQPGMKQLPLPQEHPSESIFAVIRSEIGDVTRRSAFHLDFTTPALKAIVPADPQHESDELTSLEARIEDKYLKHCNLENPLHFMTVWTARSLLARNRLYHHSSLPQNPSPQQPTDTPRGATDATSSAHTILDSNTKLMSSPHTQRFSWFTRSYFPLIAYIYLLQDMRRHPTNDFAELSWQLMADNFDINQPFVAQFGNPFVVMLGRMIMDAWYAYDAALRRLGRPMPEPRIVHTILAAIQHFDPKWRTFGAKPPLADAPLGPGGGPGGNERDIMGFLASSRPSSSLPSLGSDPSSQSFTPSPGSTQVVPGLAQDTWDFDMTGQPWFPMDWNMLNGFG